MRIPDAPADARAIGARLLVAEDDRGVRSVVATVLGATAGVMSVIEAGDGAEAVGRAGAERLDIAVLDLNMPRLDGVEAALRLRALQPWLQIALHSSDPELLRRRAAGLELPLFDKVDFGRLVEWVERTATGLSVAGGPAQLAPTAPKLDLFCSACGYGIVSRTPPPRCPMCGGKAVWDERLGWPARPAALQERLAS